MSLSRIDVVGLLSGRVLLRQAFAACGVVAMVVSLGACTPALNWREVRFDPANPTGRNARSTWVGPWHSSA
ncbi:MAG: hypothetical protein RJA29_2521 [Pseudomonadota bacterium]